MTFSEKLQRRETLTKMAVNELGAACMTNQPQIIIEVLCESVIEENYGGHWGVAKEMLTRMFLQTPPGKIFYKWQTKRSNRKFINHYCNTMKITQELDGRLTLTDNATTHHND